MPNDAHQEIKAFFYELGREEPLSKVGWWIALRWILLGVTIIATLTCNALIHLNLPAASIFFLCIPVALLNTLFHYHFFLLKKATFLNTKVVDKSTYLQFGVDWIFIAFLFHYTGGIASPLLFYFLFHVILSGVLLERWAYFTYTTLIAVTITVLAFLELLGYLHHFYGSSFISKETQKNPFFVVMLLLFFHTVLFISGSFVTKLLKRLRERILQLLDLHQKLELTNQKLELLNKVARETTSTFGLKPRLDYLCDNIRYSMGVKGVAIRLLDEKTNRLELVSSFGLSETYVKKGPVDADRSLARALKGEVHHVLDASVDPSVQYPKEARKEGIVSMLSLPLKGRNRVIGTLRLYSSERRIFAQEEVAFLSSLANQGAVSIENAKVYDALQRQDEAKKEFIMLTTHELKGPLMAIQGLLEVMLKGHVGTLMQKQKELVERMYRRIESVLGLSAELLNMYQWQSRGIDVSCALISIKEQLQRAVDLFRVMAEEKGLTITVVLPDKDLTIMGTEEDMEEVLNNLITNAIKYTPIGGSIFVGLSASESQVIMRVKDSGIGISSEDLPKIFNEFFRTKEAKMIDPDGTGLGLPFIKKIVESLGGTIRANSEKGKGTEFIITFPLA